MNRHERRAHVALHRKAQKRRTKVEIKVQCPIEENFYRIETFDDLLAGTIRVQVPYHFDGSIDTTRLPRFRGSTFIHGGKVRIEFDLDGPTLTSAVASWPSRCTKAIEEVQSQMFKSALLDQSGQPLKPQA